MESDPVVDELSFIIDEGLLWDELDSLDELLLVRGVTPELLYGLDANRNYVVDTDENLRGALVNIDNFNGRMNRGWSAYLTIFSRQRLQSPAGERKINLNSGNLKQLYNRLKEAIGDSAAKFVVAYRQFGAAPAGSSGQTVDPSVLELDFQKKAKHQIDSVLELVGVRVAVQREEPQPEQIVESPWPDNPATYRQSLLDLLDRVTTDRGRRVAGRVNLNAAARPVLMSIPEMTEPVADQIINRRNAEVDRSTGSQRHAVWILAEGIVSLEEMKRLAPYVTTGGDAYSCQVVGYLEGVLSQSRVEVVLDASGRSTRVVSWRDLGPLGPGFARSVVGSEQVGLE